MAYTPINWQTGDTITAEKMNKMDNGWGVQPTQLFSESVTTIDDGETAWGDFTYRTQITAESVIVTFNGTDYNVSGTINEDGAMVYGDLTFTDYPFFLVSSPDTNEIATQSAGTHTVAVTVPIVVVGDNFSTAVNSAIPDTSTLPFRCESGVTSLSEIAEAMLSNSRIAYFGYSGSGRSVKFFYVTSLKLNIGGAPTFTFIPEDSSISVTFDNDGIFTVTSV